MTEEPTSGGVEADRVTRRHAMRAAVVGATAAAAWSAPRIEGLSIVPDYASAATCAVNSDSRSTTKNSAAKSCNLAGIITRRICWGNAVCSISGNLGTAQCGSANGNLPALPKPAGGNIALTYSVDGDVYNGNSNTAVQSNNSRVYNLGLSGMDANVNTCTLDVTGACSSGAFRAGTNANSLGGSSNETLNTNGNFSDVWIKCVGNFNSGQNASFTLTLTCGFNC